MARREWPLQFPCAHEGCTERSNWRYQTRRDLMESFELKHYSNGRWRCIRHSNPEQVLSPSNLATRAEVESEEKHGKLFFGSWGFVSGLGFKVFADDFPVGTKLVVTAEIVLPDTARKESIR